MAEQDFSFAVRHEAVLSFRVSALLGNEKNSEENWTDDVDVKFAKSSEYLHVQKLTTRVKSARFGIGSWFPIYGCE